MTEEMIKKMCSQERTLLLLELQNYAKTQRSYLEVACRFEDAAFFEKMFEFIGKVKNGEIKLTGS